MHPKGLSTDEGWDSVSTCHCVMRVGIYILEPSTETPKSEAEPRVVGVQFSCLKIRLVDVGQGLHESHTYFWSSWERVPLGIPKGITLLLPHRPRST